MGDIGLPLSAITWLVIRPHSMLLSQVCFGALACFVSFSSHSRWLFVSVITGSISCVPPVAPSTSTSQMPLAWCASLHVVIECVMILPILFCIIAFIFVVLVSSKSSCLNTSHISDSFSIEFREWRLCILIEGIVASFVLERSIRLPHLMHTQVVPFWLLRCRCTAAVRRLCGTIRSSIGMASAFLASLLRMYCSGPLPYSVLLLSPECCLILAVDPISMANMFAVLFSKHVHAVRLPDSSFLILSSPFRPCLFIMKFVRTHLVPLSRR